MSDCQRAFANDDAEQADQVAAENRIAARGRAGRVRRRPVAVQDRKGEGTARQETGGGEPLRQSPRHIAAPECLGFDFRHQGFVRTSVCSRASANSGEVPQFPPSRGEQSWTHSYSRSSIRP